MGESEIPAGRTSHRRAILAAVGSFVGAVSAIVGIVKYGDELWGRAHAPPAPLRAVISAPHVTEVSFADARRLRAYACGRISLPESAPSHPGILARFQATVVKGTGSLHVPYDVTLRRGGTTFRHCRGEIETNVERPSGVAVYWIPLALGSGPWRVSVRLLPFRVGDAPICEQETPLFTVRVDLDVVGNDPPCQTL